jgi:iron complex outermembrane receptor protein
VAALLGAVLLGQASPARADPKDDARRHFAAALQAAQQGDYHTALERFQAAQAAYPHPVTLYNIARSYQDLGDLDQALVNYRLVRAADPSRAKDLDPVIAVLEARLAQDAGPTVPAPPSRASGTGVATDRDLAELQRIAAELEALSTSLKARAEAGPVDGAASAPTHDDAAPPDEPAPDGDFLEAAYERVVVTASRVGQAPLDAPSSVSVLTAEDIRLSGALNLPDLLRRVPGMDVMSMATGHSDVSIRGFNRELNNKVLVLIDGRSTYFDFIGTSFFATFPIALEEIDRIEIIRGPGSSTYGANAVTGVINIITRTPGEGDQVAVLDYGTPGLARGSAVATGRVGATAYRLSAGFDQHGRWAKQADVLDADGNVRDAQPLRPFFLDQDTGQRSVRMNGRLDRTLSDDVTVSLSGGMSRGDYEFYNIGTLSNYGNALDHHYLRGDVFWKNVHLRSFWNANAGRAGPWTQYEGTPQDLNARYDNDVVDLELEVPTTFTTGAVEHVLNVGGGYRYKRIAFDYLAGGIGQPYVEHHFKAFVNEQATIERLSIVGSMRLDRHPLIPIDRTLSPRGAVIYRVAASTSIRASAGTAFRAPTAIESYMEIALPTPVDGVYILDFGNQDLSPERITTFELGLHDQSSYVHQADVALYLNQVSDLIYLSDVERAFNVYDPRYNGIAAGRTGWVNLEPQYTSVGVEVDGELYPVDGIDLFTNVAVQQTTERSEGDAVVDGSTSAVKVNGGASWRTPWRTDLSLMGHFLSAQTWRLRTFDPDSLQVVPVDGPIDARFLLSARLAVRPFPDESLELAGNAWNVLSLITGEGLREHPDGQPVLGRLYASAAYRF